MPNYPDENSWWNGFTQEVNALYIEADKPPDDGRFKWFSRTGYDIGAGLEAEASKAKHMAELRSALGLPPPPAPVPSPVLRLKAEGRRLVDESGKPFRYRGLTSFRLLEQVTKGQLIAVDDTLRRAKASGANVVRVFAMCWNLFKLWPLVGRAYLLTLLDMAAKQGMYVELVCLVDTRSFPGMDFRAQLDRCDVDHPALLLEGANEIEPVHPTQDPSIVALCKAWRPQNGALYSEGSTHDTSDESTALSNGDYCTVHFDRANGDVIDEDDPNGWRFVRHQKEGWNLSQLVGRYVVSDEPRRDDLTPAKHFAMGALARICGMGDLFHYRDGLQSSPPQDDELRAYEARCAGWSTIPDNFEGTFKNSMWADGPVKSFDTTKTVRIYHSLGASEGYSLIIGKSGDPRIEWQNSWRPSAVLYDSPNVQLLRISQ